MSLAASRIATSALAWTLVVSGSGCDTPFEADRNRRPRVWVMHEPLHPAPGDTIVYTAFAEPTPGRAIRSIEISLIDHGGSGVQRSTRCSSSPCRWTHRAPSTPGIAMYSAAMEDDGGNTVSTRSAYAFHIGEPVGTNPLFLRVPFTFKHAYKVFLVRDRLTYSDDREVWDDMSTALYEQLLRDPAYRWRDNQLGFYYLREPGVTSGYDSGRSTRCGMDPWPGLPEPPEAASADVIAVIHRDTSARDCAMLGRRSGDVRSMSALGPKPAVFQHELGHTLFGLGDEYDDPDREASGRDPDLLCDCCPCASSTDPETGPGSGPGFPGLPGGECVSCLGDPRPMCPDPWIRPPDCDVPLAPSCPPLESACPGEPNIFRSESECQAASADINAHPGVEMNSTAVTDCRLICESCPCGGPPMWKIDYREPDHPAVPERGDIMESTEDGFTRNVSACERCMEDEFCFAWETTRGQTQEEANEACGTAVR